MLNAHFSKVRCIFNEFDQILDSFFLFLGNKGYVACSVEFGDALRSVGATAHTVLYAGKTHTDLFLQVCESLHISLVRNSTNPILENTL